VVRSGIAFLFVLMSMVLVVGSSFRVFAVDESEANARTAIINAESTVFDCYGAALDTEKAGANVTELLSVLNEAGMLLSRANLAYENGDFNSSVYFANQSILKLNGFVAEAGVLKETALQQRYWDFVVNVVGSAVGAIAVICGGVVIWVFLKKREEGRSA